MKSPKKILLIRNDKLGDFMLAWPALSLLKKQYPESEVTALIPAYTKPIAEICPWIDYIIIDDTCRNVFADARHLATKLKPYNFDASISLYSEVRTSLALFLAHIPKRFGPATKISQIFLNKKLRQKRSSSKKPEYEYNIDLVRHYISCSNDNAVSIKQPPYLSFNEQEVTTLRQTYFKNNNINAEYKLIFIHAGTGGSAINLSLQQFAELAKKIAHSNQVHFILTAGPNEIDTAKNLSNLLSNISHNVYHSTEGLVSFSKFINICDLFISGSTGPLHIAGALNVATAAFYPAGQSATSLRWQTINEKNKRLAFTPKTYTGENDMQTIDVNECGKEINALLARLT